MATFRPGLELCGRFYTGAVRPLLDTAYPDLPHAAARVGPGSDVLGFDTPRSTDHDWGPRLTLFLTAADAARHGPAIVDLLARRLPPLFDGWSTHFEPVDARVRVMAPAPSGGPVAHRVEVTDVGTWCTGLLGFDPRTGAGLLDRLAAPWQALAETTGGAVYHDGVGDLSAVRERLDWYPTDLWRYVLARQWTRLGEEEAFVGRTAEVGDDLGSRVVAAGMVRELLRLCLLLARRYPPYAKWLGTAASSVASAVVGPAHGALVARDSGERQGLLCDAVEAAGRWQNRLGLAAPVDPGRRPFHDRPFPVVDTAGFAAALLAAVEDPEVAALAPVGCVDQYAYGADVLGRPQLTRAMAAAILAS